MGKCFECAEQIRKTALKGLQLHEGRIWVSQQEIETESELRNLSQSHCFFLICSLLLKRTFLNGVCISKIKKSLNNTDCMLHMYHI